MRKNRKTRTRSFNGTQTPFAQRIYAVVAAIPRGKTMTYRAVAARAGRPAAARAVGGILNKNRDARVPCHRVIKSDGTAGGYAWGGRKKKALLVREGAVVY